MTGDYLALLVARATSAVTGRSLSREIPLRCQSA
jgi:hypothetical protein